MTDEEIDHILARLQGGDLTLLLLVAPEAAQCIRELRARRDGLQGMIDDMARSMGAI